MSYVCEWCFNVSFLFFRGFQIFDDFFMKSYIFSQNVDTPYIILLQNVDGTYIMLLQNVDMHTLIAAQNVDATEITCYICPCKAKAADIRMITAAFALCFDLTASAALFSSPYR